MQYYNTELQQEIIDKIVAQIKKNLSAEQVKLLEPFARYYFSKVSAQDLADRDITDLYGSVISAWKFLIERKDAQESAVRVYNPDYEECGWESNHTVIEIAMPNCPFVLDSIRNELARHGHTIYMMICPGGVVLKRDKKNKVVDFKPANHQGKNEVVELPVYVEINRQPDQNYINELKYHIEFILDDVKTAVNDWDEMQVEAKAMLEGIDNDAIKAPEDIIKEAKAFVKWIINNNFTFLGMADYEYDENHELQRIPDSVLGLAKTKPYSITKTVDGENNGCTKDVCDTNALIWMQQLNEISTVHRPSRPYCIATKQYDKKGKEVGERRFYGLFTSVAYHSSPDEIPLIRIKVQNVIARAGFAYYDHNGRTLFNILETYPRDELFQSSEDDLLDICMGIMQLQERRRVSLFIRKDYYNRYLSCLIYVPRERFNSDLREKMSDILMDAFGGDHVDFMTRFSESILARIHLMIYLPHGAEIPAFDPKHLEDLIAEAGRTWTDELYEALLDHFGEATAVSLYEKYKDAFPAGYQEVYSARTAVHDIEHLEALKDKGDIGMNLHRPVEQMNGFVCFKLYLHSEAIPLSDALPLLEHMGFKVFAERSNEIRVKQHNLWVSEFSLESCDHKLMEIDQVKNNFQEAFARTWRGDAESDNFNTLVLTAGLNWREASLMRAYAKYFTQIGFRFSQSYIEETLILYPQVVKKLVQLFHHYFDPEKAGQENIIEDINNDILKSIDAVSNLDQDRILRCYLATIHATLRTNFYQFAESRDHKSYISFKIKSKEIPEVPLPHPAFEIFVYSPIVEGVHLRGGKVARGGLRWSDRREDFRTEILGLMKAQQVKNAVIVPTGAKGGFVPKQLPNGSREDIMNEVVRCYKTFISGLLDITDNRVADEIQPPVDVVRRDEDDPYLVVAADKGTATFSDIANDVAKEYNFWLGDAFASGGSQGYDHKKMGITARGAWESVKRHFRELGKDIQTEDFTVIGVGDMSGDVFGNGMLLSEHLKLVAAFNHIHIFVDPNPDPKTSFAERKRLFEMPRSSWSDYDEKLISKGGGVFRRSAKSIAITPEMKKALDITADALTPNDLIIAILKAPVDLFWNGGIGTYVKASTEQNIEVGDRANDPVRINGRELRAKVVGEGGNLGLTQLGRIQYALSGGILYTDFIDNSAGVDCSDHEVNIKILLNHIIEDGDMTEKQRNELLALMTDEVAELVLEDNYQQTQAISLASWRSSSTFDEYIRFMVDLERNQLLNRELEFLPSDKTLSQRRASNKGIFTRPELSVLLSYSKITLKESLMQSEVIDDPYLTSYLKDAFPDRLSKRFVKQMQSHQLKREIIATQLANDIINRMGATYVKRLYDETGATPNDIANSFIVSKSIFNMDYFWDNIQALDNKIDTSLQSEMMVVVMRLVRRASRWFLRNRRAGIQVKETIELFKPLVEELYDHTPDFLAGEELDKLYENTKHLEEKGLDHQFALRVASCRAMISALDIIEASINTDVPLQEIAHVYFAVGARLELDWFRAKIAQHDVTNNWDALARAASRDDVDRQQRSLTESILQYCSGFDNTAEAIDAWESEHEQLVQRWRFMIADLRATTSEDFTMFAVALRELLDLAQASVSRLELRKHA